MHGDGTLDQEMINLHVVKDFIQIFQCQGQRARGGTSRPQKDSIA